jgi:hypothetical protein
MATQTATTGNLDDAQGIMIATCRYTAEHSAPCANLIEHMNLPKGDKQITVPKVAQMTASDLVDGKDMVDSEDIGMSTVDLTTAEVGLKVIITDKLARQENEDTFKIVGRQMGDAMGRKKDEDIIALFSALNSGTALGGDNKNLTLTNLSACIAWAKGNKLPNPVAVVHHPYAIYQTVASAALTPSQTYPIPHGYSEDLVKDFWKFTVNGIAVFEDGNIDKISGYDSGYGAIFSKEAMVIVESQGYRTERDKDISLRATEVVVTADYGCFELDDGYGAAMQYEIGAPSTDA